MIDIQKLKSFFYGHQSTYENISNSTTEEYSVEIQFAIAEQLKRIADVQEEKLKILRAKGKN